MNEKKIENKKHLVITSNFSRLPLLWLATKRRVRVEEEKGKVEKTTTGGEMTRALKIVVIMIEKIATETRRGRREEKRAKTRAIGNNNNNNKQKSLGKTDKQGTFQKDKRPRSTMAIISTNQSRLMMIYKMKRRLKIHILRR